MLLYNFHITLHNIGGDGIDNILIVGEHFVTVSCLQPSM